MLVGVCEGLTHHEQFKRYVGFLVLYTVQVRSPVLTVRRCSRTLTDAA